MASAGPLRSLPTALRRTLDGWRADRTLEWVVGLSGGLDSTVLLHALVQAGPHPGGLRAVHVHHGWSPAADDWAAHCERFCTELGVPLTVLRVQMDRGDGRGPEAQARRARYTALRAELAPNARLLTAHHAQDQAETVLLRLLRGEGLDGIAGMRARARIYGLSVWRPLLAIERTELGTYAQHHGLRTLADPSNTDPRLARGWLRRELLPVLTQRHPQLLRTLERSARFLRSDAEVLAEASMQGVARCRLLDPATLDLRALAREVPGLRLRVLRRWLAELGHPNVPVHLLEHILSRSTEQRCEPGAVWQSGRLRLRCAEDVLHAEVCGPAVSDWSLNFDGTPTRLPDGSVLSLPGLQLSGWKLGNRRGGERIWLRGVHRPLKKVLQELALPAWERERLVLLSAPTGTGDWQLRAVLGIVLDDGFRQHLEASRSRLHWDRGELS